MRIYPNLLPAETYLYFKRKENVNTCISTCSFVDIKSFYQDTYESLASLLFIPVCLDNISRRENHLSFSKDVERIIQQKMRDKRNSDIESELQAYLILDNGIKISKLNSSEKFQKMMVMPNNSYLRNGIGHNNYKYDGITQKVIAYDLKNPEIIKYQGSLMDVAISCIGMAKTIVCVSEIILFLLRRELKKEGVKSIMHPRFYKKAEPNSKCPCGSGAKYKRCCMNEVEAISRKKA